MKHTLSEFAPEDQVLLQAALAASMQVALVYHDAEGPTVLGLAMHPTRFVGSHAADVLQLTSIEGL